MIKMSSKVPREHGRGHIAGIKKGPKSFYGRPYRIPQAYRKVLKTEVDWRIKIGLFTRITETEWTAPSFIILKKAIQYDS